MNDEQKRKKLDEFHREFEKLLDKYPEILIFGDDDGSVKASISLSSPNYKRVELIPMTVI